MSEAKWLDGYSGQTTSDLISLDGEYRTDSVVLAFEEALQQKAARVGEERLSEPERVVLAIEALEREVNNGGFDQFFRNSSNAYVPIIVASLEKIGCPQVAKLAQRAVDALRLKGAPSTSAIEEAMECEDDKRSELLERCDSQYFDQAGDLAGPLLAFIKKNRAAIVLE